MDDSHTDMNRRQYSREDVLAIAETYRRWGRWGDDDELGAANLITREHVVESANLIRSGKTFSLALPLDRNGPMRGGGPRVNPQHVMLRLPSERLSGMTGVDKDGLQSSSDDALYMPLQSSTQWDAFCHIYYDGKTYNGRTAESVTAFDGALHNSITNFRDRALGRAVLLDLPRFLGKAALQPGEAIQENDLEACAEKQRVEIRAGDFVIVRTGHLEARRKTGDWGDYSGGSAPGLGVSSAHFFCGRDVVGVATDTWGIEAIPFETDELLSPLHIILLVNAGIYIGEMWDLEKLAADCADDGIYDFFLVAQPLTVTGSTGSPLNPLAVK